MLRRVIVVTMKLQIFNRVEVLAVVSYTKYGRTFLYHHSNVDYVFLVRFFKSVLGYIVAHFLDT